ncbi:MAG: EAL domain-containing protein [Maricaulaceae bacterium]
MTLSDADHQNLSADLRSLGEAIAEALRNDRIELAFQPQYDTRGSGVRGFEALARWRRIDGALVSAGHFIDAIEAMGLIGDLGDYVLRKACEAGARLVETNRPTLIAVNISATQLERPDFADHVKAEIARASLDPELIEIELTEHVAVQDVHRAAEQMRPLRELGVRFALDDFGAGYATLSALAALPFDAVKLDRSLIAEIDTAPQSRRLVEAVMAVARTWRMEVVAEGVERGEQLAVLQLIGCRAVQGYHLGKPAGEAEMMAMIDDAWAIEEIPPASLDTLARHGFVIK